MLDICMYTTFDHYLQDKMFWECTCSPHAYLSTVK